MEIPLKLKWLGKETGELCDLLSPFHPMILVSLTPQLRNRDLPAGFIRLPHWRIIPDSHSVQAVWCKVVIRSAFASEDAQGDVLQISTLNSGSGSFGNVNTYLYYRLIEWCITHGYEYFSFGRENLMLPPNAYLNVVGSKRSSGTTTVIESDPARLEFVLCNRNALLHLRSDYFLFSWDSNTYGLIYFANDEKIPKSLSQMLENDSYMDKHVYTRKRSIFSYLEKRALHWENVVLVLCSANGTTEHSFSLPPLRGQVARAKTPHYWHRRRHES